MSDHGPTARQRLVQFGLLGVGGGLAGWLLLDVFDRSVRPVLVIALVLGGAVLAGFVAVAFDHQADPVTTPRRAREPQDEIAAGAGRYTAELESFERRLDAAMSDPARFERILVPLLTDLATQRLRSRRNLDPRSEDARHLLGDDLWRTTTSSDLPPAPPSRAELTEWIGRIEAI